MKEDEKMDLVSKYKEYRKEQVKLHSNILNEVAPPNFMYTSAEMLGITQGKAIVIETEYEKEVLLDFTVYEKNKNGRNLVSEYIACQKELTELEAKLLAAMEHAETALYEAIAIEKENNVLYLKEVSNDKNELIKVIDIGMSSSFKEGTLVFTRLIKLDEFSMTTGLGFYFSKNHKQYLVSRSKKLMKKVNSEYASVKRFAAFFHLNRLDGLQSLFETVE